MTHLRLSSALLVLVSVVSSVNAWAEEGKTREIKPRDTLAEIVANEYAGYKNRNAIMQEIFKANPEAFSKQDINRLIVGKNLKLPDVSNIAGMDAVATAGAVNPDVQKKLQSLENTRKELEDTLKLIEEENTSLQSMVGKYEEQKQSQDAQIAQLEEKVKKLEGTPPSSPTENDAVTPMATDATASESATVLPATPPVGTTPEPALKTELDSAQQKLAETSRVTDALKTQLAESERQKTDLQEQLQDAHNTVENIQSEVASSNWLPWSLVGLLFLLSLTLLWLIRKRLRLEQPTKPLETASSKPSFIAEPMTISTASPVVKESIVTETVASHAVASQAIPTVTSPQVTVSSDERNLNTLLSGNVAKDDNPESDLKLDIARAYLDLRNAAAASAVLEDVLTEGGMRQRQEAREILSFIS